MKTKSLTPAAVVALWDSGETIWSVELGGIGPNYELAIQSLVVELLRDGEQLSKSLPQPGQKEWSGWGDEAVARLNETQGFSGAQVGAAKNFAFHILRDGYQPTLDRAGIRMIQVRKLRPSDVAR